MKARLPWLLLPVLLAACDTEKPVGIGDDLLPGDAVNTFELILEPADFLVRDTSFALYTAVEDADFTFLAREWGGAVTSNAFARFDIPTVIGVVDTLGVSRVDSTAKYVRGEIILVPDTVATTGPDPLLVAVHNFAEDWDPAVADWTLRATGANWTVPGGTTGALVDTARWVRGDTLRLAVDSATLALWADSANGARGAHLSVLGAPARLRSTIPRLQLWARSRYKPDTLFTVFAQAPESRFAFTPALPTRAADLRFNGTPGWRGFLEFRPDLRTRIVPCGAGCTVRLRDADITRAELLLQPRTTPPGFDPELPIAPIAFSALVTPQMPLERTPLGTAIGTTSRNLTGEDFADDAEAVPVIITEFLRQMVQDTTTDGSTGRTDWLAITSGQVRTFGFGRFAAGPRLRLVLTTAQEIRLP